jgi:hypothetical protein
MSLVLRGVKGEALTHQELDDNQTYLLSRADKGYLNIADFQNNDETNFANPDEWTPLLFTPIEVAKRFNGIDWEIDNLGFPVIFNDTQNKDLLVKVEAIASITGTNNNEIHFAVFLNGNLWPCSEQNTSIRGNNRGYTIPFHCSVPLNVGSYIQIFAKNRLSTNKINISNINLIAEIKDIQDAPII